MRVGHGLGAEKQEAILTPQRVTQKQKAAEAAFCSNHAQRFTRKGQAVVVLARRRP
jgi:hypothetical protein